MGYRVMGIVTRVRLLGLWLGGGLRSGWSPVRFMRSPVVTVTSVIVLCVTRQKHLVYATMTFLQMAHKPIIDWTLVQQTGQNADNCACHLTHIS